MSAVFSLLFFLFLMTGSFASILLLFKVREQDRRIKEFEQDLALIVPLLPTR